jgi:signal transduction histidine kinase/ActR/RegA family two-component response regulator
MLHSIKTVASGLSAVTMCFLMTAGSDLLASDTIVEAIHAADEAIMVPDNHEAALAMAKVVRELGIEHDDPATEARGLIRMGFVSLHFGDWSDVVGQWRSRAEKLIADLPPAHVARAEVMMFEGYLDAMYFHRTKEGIARLQKSINIARALPDDNLLAKAFYLLGRVLPYDAQDRLAFECLQRSSKFAREAGLSRWELVALKRAAAFRTRLDADAPRTQRLAELSQQLSIEPAFEDLPTAQRVRVAREMVVKIQAGYDQPHLPCSLQDVLDGLEASKYLTTYYMEREQWAEWEANLTIAERCAMNLQSESDVQSVYVERGAGLARQGRIDEAITAARRFLDHKEKIQHYGELSRVYAYLARQAGKGGDADTAYEWFNKADAYKVKQDAALLVSLTASADEYFANELESRKLLSELHGREETLARSQARNTQLLVGAALCLVCIWFWQRARQHRIAQGRLQEQVDQQTESLQAAKDAAETANKAKTDFLARVNHELRNPLTALVGSCEILGDHLGDDPVVTKCGDTITACSQSLVDVIDDILDFTQIESGELSLRESVFSVSDLLGTVRSIIQTKLADGVELQLLMDTDIPDQIRADEAKLRQILINLAINSVRHTDQGHVRIECRMVRPQTPGAKPGLVLAVADTGSGMSEADQESVFSQYKTHSERSNTGLGLYISRAFVECMGGEISCSSQLGKGTTFSLAIPFESVQGKQRLSDSPVKPVLPSADGKLSFLVVDDEALNRETIGMLLGQLGHDATAVESWAAVAEVLTSQHVDVVLMDLQMPEMSGYQMLDRVKELSLPNSPPIIALTGDATSWTREKAVVAGFSGFMAKPFRVANLIQLLESLPGTRRAA